jgi:hypothetical protein
VPSGIITAGSKIRLFVGSPWRIVSQIDATSVHTG